MKILLNRLNYYDKWMLPGGFVYMDEHVDHAAVRTLTQRTGLKDIYLKQFHLFGNYDRVSSEESRSMFSRMEQMNPTPNDPAWFMQRFISVGYYAFVEYSRTHIPLNENEEIKWFTLAEVSGLYADHNAIIEKAVSTLRGQLNSVPIGYELLPEKFTLAQLRTIYEILLDKPLDRRNFQRKILSTGLVVKLNELHRRYGYKSAGLYRFDKEKYEEALLNGISVF